MVRIQYKFVDAIQVIDLKKNRYYNISNTLRGLQVSELYRSSHKDNIELKNANVCLIHLFAQRIFT